MVEMGATFTVPPNKVQNHRHHPYKVTLYHALKALKSCATGAIWTQFVAF
jgi:hypothetical protein